MFKAVLNLGKAYRLAYKKNQVGVFEFFVLLHLATYDTINL